MPHPKKMEGAAANDQSVPEKNKEMILQTTPVHVQVLSASTLIKDMKDFIQVHLPTKYSVYRDIKKSMQAG